MPVWAAGLEERWVHLRRRRGCSRWSRGRSRLEAIRVTTKSLTLALPEGEMILALGEFEEEGEGFLTLEERIYSLENQVAALAGVVSELILIVGVANSYVIMEDEGTDRSRIVQEAKNVAGDIGNLAQKMRELWPPSP
jgi:hypothetical protein